MCENFSVTNQETTMATLWSSTKLPRWTFKENIFEKTEDMFQSQSKLYPVLHLRYPLAVQSDLITFDKGPFI